MENKRQRFSMDEGQHLSAFSSPQVPLGLSNSHFASSRLPLSSQGLPLGYPLPLPSTSTSTSTYVHSPLQQMISPNIHSYVNKNLISNSTNAIPSSFTAHQPDLPFIREGSSFQGNAPTFLGVDVPTGEKFVTKQTLDGIIISCSSNVQKFLGYEPASLYHTSTYELIHPEDLNAVLQIHLRLLEQGPSTPLSGRYRVLRKDGYYISVHSVFLLEVSDFQSMYDPNDFSLVILGISVDVSPEKNPTPSFSFVDGLLEDPPQISNPNSVESLRQQIEYLKSSISRTTQIISSLKSDLREKGNFDSEPSESLPLNSSLPPELKASSGDLGGAGSSGEDSPIAKNPKSRTGPKRERKMRKPPFGESCGECQATESSEWRKGPTPDRLLCNACGLRYTRKVKKEERVKQKGGSSTGEPQDR